MNIKDILCHITNSSNNVSTTSFVASTPLDENDLVAIDPSDPTKVIKFTGETGQTCLGFAVKNVCGSEIGDCVDIQIDGAVVALANLDKANQKKPLDITIETTADGRCVIKYCDPADGLEKEVDASKFLDDTNLPQIVSGVINGDGDLVLTRDDGTTVTIDLPDPQPDVVDVSIDPITGEITVTVNGVSDSITLPQDPDPVVNLGFDPNSCQLRVEIDGVAQQIVLPEPLPPTFDPNTCELVYVSKDGTETRRQITNVNFGFDADTQPITDYVNLLAHDENGKAVPAEVVCKGPYPWEQLSINGGTLADGTTYTITDSGGSLTDLGNGDIEGTIDGTITVTFSAPVDFQAADVDAAGRSVWHTDGVNTSQAITDGGTWCYEPDLVDALIDIDGQVASATIDGINAPFIVGGDGWGTITSFKAQKIEFIQNFLDRYKFTARPLGLIDDVPICDVVDDLRQKLKQAENVCFDFDDTTVGDKDFINLIGHDENGKPTAVNFKDFRVPINYWNLDLNAPSISVVNPSFELGTGLPGLGSVGQVPKGNIPGWDTTDTNNTIEIWGTGFQGVPAFDGNYFAEMNSSQPARLSQNITVPENSGMIVWSLAHSARSPGPRAWSDPTVVNSAQVIISQDGVDQVVETLMSNSGSWTEYSGQVFKECGVTEIEIAFNSLDPGSTGNFLDNIQLSFQTFEVRCRVGHVDCSGELFDEDGQPLAGQVFTLCNPLCPVEPPVSSVTQDLAADTITHNSGDGSAATVLDLSKYKEQTITWAWEENDSLATNTGASQWSVGNGSTGVTAQVAPVDMLLKRGTFHAETAGTSVDIEVRNNLGALLHTFTFNGQTGVEVLANPVLIRQGTAVTLNTGTEVGAYTDARVNLFFTHEGI